MDWIIYFAVRIILIEVKVKVKFTLEQITKALGPRWGLLVSATPRPLCLR